MATILRDHYGSVARLREQEEKDAAELARLVRSLFSGGAGILALRPIEERIAASTPRVKDPVEVTVRAIRKAYKKGRINKAEMRKAIRAAVTL